MLLVEHSQYDGYDEREQNRANGEEFIHIFVNNSEMLVTFLQHMIKVKYPQNCLDVKVFTLKNEWEIYRHYYFEENILIFV